jgi:hypothetical protein
VGMYAVVELRDQVFGAFYVFMFADCASHRDSLV